MVDTSSKLFLSLAPNILRVEWWDIVYAGMETAEDAEQPFKQLISQRVTPFAISLSEKYLTPWAMIPCNVTEMLIGDAFALHAEELRTMFSTWHAIDVFRTSAFELRRKEGKLRILRGGHQCRI